MNSQDIRVDLGKILRETTKKVVKNNYIYIDVQNVRLTIKLQNDL